MTADFKFITVDWISHGKTRIDFVKRNNNKIFIYVNILQGDRLPLVIKSRTTNGEARTDADGGHVSLFSDFFAPVVTDNA